MKLKLIIVFYLFTLVHTRFLKRIIGGSDADPSVFTNLVAVYSFRRTGEQMGYLFCAGTIYNAKWIVVTGYCASEIIRTVLIEHIRVIAGKWNLTQIERPMQTRAVVLVRQHEDYNPLQLDKSINSGLLKLRTALEFNQFISAFPFLVDPAYPSGDAIIIGYGSKTRIQANNSQLGDILQVLTVHVMSIEDCRNAIGTIPLEIEETFFNEFHFCTEPLTLVVSSPSYGDDGGPVLQLNETSQYNVIGIISAVKDESGLGVHIHASWMIPWIESEITRYPDP